MKIPLVAGRDLMDDDTEPGKALVNETFTKQFFGGENPIGRSFETPVNSKPGKPFKLTFEVVGEVGDVAYSDLREPHLPVAYIPIRLQSQNGGLRPLRGETIVVRTVGDDPMAMAQTLRHMVKQVDPEFGVSNMQTQEELIRNLTIRERLLATLGGFFAVVALLLAAIGLYGVLHYSIVQREKEIGIRLALGAAAGNIARLVTFRVFAMVLVGAAIGQGLGMVSVRYVASLLYGVKGNDPKMLVMPTIVLLVVALTAAMPAVLRASRIDPTVMLRAE